MSEAPKRSRANAGLGAESPLSSTAMEPKRPRVVWGFAPHEEQSSSSAALAVSGSEGMSSADIALYGPDAAPPADLQKEASMPPLHQTLHTDVCAQTGSSESTVGLHPSFHAPSPFSAGATTHAGGLTVSNGVDIGTPVNTPAITNADTHHSPPAFHAPSLVLPSAPLSSAGGAHANTAHPTYGQTASGGGNSGTAPTEVPPVAQVLALYTSVEGRRQVLRWLKSFEDHKLILLDEDPEFYETLLRAVVTSTPSDDVVITLESPWPTLEVERSTLFVRRRVVDFLDTILASRTESKISELILGSPGIGKTSTGLYLLYRLGIVEKLPVVYYFCDGRYSPFISIRNGVCLRSRNITDAQLDEFMLEGDFVILDSVAPSSPVYHKAAHVIEVSLPDFRKYASFEQYIDEPCFLPDWSAEDVCHFYSECHKDIPLCCVEAAFSIVGGNLRAIRMVLRKKAFASLKAHSPDDDNVHALVIAAAKEMVRVRTCANLL